MGDTWISNYFGKSVHVFAVWCKWLAGWLTWPMACGTLFLWYCNGAHRWIYTGSCGVDPPLSIVASGVLFYDWWTNPHGINGRRAGGKLQLACNGDMTTSIKVSGERSD